MTTEGARTLAFGFSPKYKHSRTPVRTGPDFANPFQLVGGRRGPKCRSIRPGVPPSGSEPWFAATVRVGDPTEHLHTHRKHGREGHQTQW